MFGQKGVSSRLHPNPNAEGDHESAWLQPVVVAEAKESGLGVGDG